MLVARCSAVGRACRPLKSRKQQYRIAPSSTNNAAFQTRAVSGIAVVEGKGKARQIDEEEHVEQEQPPKEPLRLDLDAASTSKLPNSPSTSPSSSSSAPPAVLQRTIAIHNLSDACRQTDSSRAWTIFASMTAAHRRELPESVLHDLLLHQSRYSQRKGRRRNLGETGDELVDESARECWRRAGTILLSIRYLSSEIKDTIRDIAKRTLEEIRASADSAQERYTRPGTALITTSSGKYRASTLLQAHRRYCGNQSIEIYQKLLIFGISVDQELYDLITHLGNYIPQHECVPFSILRRAAQSVLPLRSVEDGHKRQRLIPPKPTNDLTEEEALLRITILTGANAKQLFKLALETRDYLLAQYLYTYLRPSSTLLPSPSDSSSTSSSSIPVNATPLLRRRAKRGDNRFLWTSEDTPSFISLFRSLAYDALHFRQSRSSKERLASLASCSVLYEHWIKDENATPANLKEEITDVAVAQIVPEYGEKMWSLLLKDQSFTFEMPHLEGIIAKLKKWNNENARQKAHNISKRLLAPRSRYSHLISQKLYTLLLQTFAKPEVPEASLGEEGASLLKAALKPFEEVWAHLLKHGQPDLDAYKAHLQLRARTQEYDTIIKTWKNMLKADIVPDQAAYGYIVWAYVRTKDWNAAADTVKQASSAGIVLKEKVILQFLECAKEAGQTEIALRTYEDWNAVLNIQRPSRKTTVGEDLQKLVEELKGEVQHGKPDEVTTEKRKGSDTVAAQDLAITEEIKDRIPALGFQVAAAPAVEEHKADTQTQEEKAGKPFLAAFFTSNDCASPEATETEGDTAVALSEPARVYEPTEEEPTFLAPALPFNRSPTISFPSFSLSQASAASKASENSIFASSSRHPSRNYHPANTWEAMLELAQKAREQLDNYACREQALQLADNRLRLERADMGRWSGWKEHHATPWY